MLKLTVFADVAVKSLKGIETRPNEIVPEPMERAAMGTIVGRRRDPCPKSLAHNVGQSSTHTRRSLPRSGVLALDSGASATVLCRSRS